MMLTQFVGDYLMAHDIHSRAEKRDYGVDSHAETDRIVRPGELGGIRHAVAPTAEWLFWAGLAIAIAALGTAVWFAGQGIGHLLDVAFFAAGQWSASS